MAVQNPIVIPAGWAAIDSDVEHERWLQARLHLWLKRYFNGTPFWTRTVDGRLEQRSFEHCDVVWGQTFNLRPVRPELHWTEVDRREERCDDRVGEAARVVRWHWNVAVRVRSNLTGQTNASGTAEHQARRVADQVAWLVGSTERDALGEEGISRVRLEMGPLEISANQNMVRNLQVSMRTRRRQAALWGVEKVIYQRDAGGEVLVDAGGEPMPDIP